MPGTFTGDTTEHALADDAPNARVAVDNPVKKQKDSDKNIEYPMPSCQEEVEAIKKKYGGMVPKTLTLISKGNARAYFDSADWAMAKQQGAQKQGPFIELCPKWEQRNHRQVLSRFSPHYAPPAHDGKGRNNSVAPVEDQISKLEGDNNNCLILSDFY